MAWIPRNEAPKTSQGGPFLFPDALSDAEESELGLGEAEDRVAEVTHIDVDEDLYTNVMLSMLSTGDNFATKTSSLLLIILVAFLQCILSFAIYKHVQIAMSWGTSSIKAHSIHSVYSDFLHNNRLAYIRMQLQDVTEICGDFEYNLIETGLGGTNWTSYFEYEKVPVNSWHAWQIPPTERSLIDEARYVLENEQYIYVYYIVTFMWILSIIYGFRRILQLCMAIGHLPILKHRHDPILRKDEDEFEILALTYPAKLIGVACVLYRIFISSIITWVGCQFLLWTTVNIDLILNALALTFVLELDEITYKAAISTSRQNLISKLKRLSYRDPTESKRCRSFNKISMVLCILGTSGAATFALRQVQHAAYMDMFTVAASLCLFQGPTPGYWSQFRATFPVPGFCETVLDLKCEAPIVGEEGQPCVENWNQKLCKFYARTDSLFSTWTSIDWQNQGSCMANHDGVISLIEDVNLDGCGITHKILGDTCIAMWQRRPQVEFQGKERENTGPRLRVYPYEIFLPAAPFWCDFTEGADQVLQPKGPADILTWTDALRDCNGSRLIYSGGHGNGALQNGIEDEADAAGVMNLTESTAMFSGVWLSPKMGVVVIETKGMSAKVSNALLPQSPVPAKVDIAKKKLTFLTDPYYTCTLGDDGMLRMSNGEVLVNQKTEMEKAKPEDKGSGRPPFFMWMR